MATFYFYLNNKVEIHVPSITNFVHHPFFSITVPYQLFSVTDNSYLGTGTGFKDRSSVALAQIMWHFEEEKTCYFKRTVSPD